MRRLLFICALSVASLAAQSVGGGIGQASQPATAITATSAAISNVETAVVSLVIPANTLQVGSSYLITANGTGTTTVANTNTFRVRIGTSGTSTDVAVVTETLTAGTTGTSIPFISQWIVTVRTTGAGGTIYGSGWFSNNASSGLNNAGTGTQSTVPAAAVAVDTTVQNTLQLSYVSAATTTAATFFSASIKPL